MNESLPIIAVTESPHGPPPTTTTAYWESTLTVVNNGTWTNSPSSYSYQWFINGNTLGDETSDYYTTVIIDNGLTFNCRVIANNSVGSSIPAFSNSFEIVHPPPP
jgi:hypothetical protein